MSPVSLQPATFGIPALHFNSPTGRSAVRNSRRHSTDVESHCIFFATSKYRQTAPANPFCIVSELFTLLNFEMKFRGLGCAISLQEGRVLPPGQQRNKLEPKHSQRYTPSRAQW